MPNMLTIEIDLDRLHKYGVVKNPTGHVGDLLAETLDRFARTQYGTGTNSNGEYNVWTHNTAHVGTARVTRTGDADHAEDDVLDVPDPTPVVVCETCEDYVDDPRLRETAEGDEDVYGAGWVHMSTGSSRCPGQEDDDTGDHASPYHTTVGEAFPDGTPT